MFVWKLEYRIQDEYKVQKIAFIWNTFFFFNYVRKYYWSKCLNGRVYLSTKVILAQEVLKIMTSIHSIKFLNFILILHFFLEDMFSFFFFVVVKTYSFKHDFYAFLYIIHQYIQQNIWKPNQMKIQIHKHGVNSKLKDVTFQKISLEVNVLSKVHTLLQS